MLSTIAEALFRWERRERETISLVWYSEGGYWGEWTAEKADRKGSSPTLRREHGSSPALSGFVDELLELGTAAGIGIEMVAHPRPGRVLLWWKDEDGSRHYDAGDFPEANRNP